MPCLLSDSWGWEVGTGRTPSTRAPTKEGSCVFSARLDLRKWQVLKHSAWWEQKQYVQVARSSRVPMGSLEEDVGLAYSRASQGVRERRYSGHHRGTRRHWMTVTFSKWDGSLWESLRRKVHIRTNDAKGVYGSCNENRRQVRHTSLRQKDQRPPGPTFYITLLCPEMVQPAEDTSKRLGVGCYRVLWGILEENLCGSTSSYSWALTPRPVSSEARTTLRKMHPAWSCNQKSQDKTTSSKRGQKRNTNVFSTLEQSKEKVWAELSILCMRKKVGGMAFQLCKHSRTQKGKEIQSAKEQ